MYSHLTSLSLLLLSFIQHAFLIDAFTIEERANGGVSCCRQLSKNYDTLVSYVGSTLYHDQQMGVPNGYWSQQAAELSPVCRFTPRTATDVSGAVRILTDKQCKFAIRGGGHMSWAEAANIQNGVTIDLSGMKLVSVSQDRTTTSVQGGARWVDVYMKLDAMELAVSGGRVYDVGVGGLTLGGGNSFFGPRSGFGCDNVRSFEVVLANGTIVNANLQQNPDLFKALKGGSNNFGIVTKFDLITFEQGQMWGGFVIYPPQTVEQQVQALQGFTQASGDGVDPYAAVINSYIFKADGLAFIANYYTYTKPQANPAILTNFTAIQPQTQSGLRTTNLTTMTIELAAGTPNGYRQLFGTATFKNDASLLSKILALANETYAPVRHLRDFQASVTLQPISRAQTSKGEGMGGNSLGLDASRGDLVCELSPSPSCFYDPNLHPSLLPYRE